MRLSKLIMPLVCLCTLSSCGTSATRDEFFEKATNTKERHQYKKVSVDYYTKTDTEKAEGTSTFTLKSGSYVADKSNDLNTVISMYFSLTPATIKIEESFLSMKHSWESYYKYDGKVEWNVDYYVNPFKVVASYKATVDTPEETAERTMDFTYKFNDNCNITYYEGKISQKAHSEKDGIKQEENASSVTKITFKYSD